MNEIGKSAIRAAADATATVVQTTVTAALATRFGPLAVPTGAAAGAMVKEIPLLAQLFADRRRNATDMMERAVAHTGVTPEEFVAALTGDPKHRDLLRRAIEAASDSVDDEKIRTLAAALAAGALATDDAVLDESVFVINAVAQLEAVDLRVLALLATEPAKPEAEVRGISPPPWTSRQVQEAVPHLAPVLPAVLAKLYALGMTEDFLSVSTNSWEDYRNLTRFGQLCLGYLQALAGERPNHDREASFAPLPQT